MNNKVGRPVKFTPDEFKELFEQYVTQCIDKELFPNLAGFAVYGKFNQDTFYEYKKNRPEFSESIKKIESLLEDTTIQNAIRKPSAFLIFYMKNKFGYTDKTEVSSTIQIDKKSEQRAKSLLDEALGTETK
jgi:hypothetical protein